MGNTIPIVDSCRWAPLFPAAERARGPGCRALYTMRCRAELGILRRWDLRGWGGKMHPAGSDGKTVLSSGLICARPRLPGAHPPGPRAPSRWVKKQKHFGSARAYPQRVSPMSVYRTFNCARPSFSGLSVLGSCGAIQTVAIEGLSKLQRSIANDRRKLTLYARHSLTKSPRPPL